MSFRMDEYGASTYGDRVADVYDEWFPSDDSVEAAVETLAELAGDQPALELAIGTGRIAIPLAARRLDVHGIDASEAMVARLRAKPGGRSIPVTIGDFADVDVDGPFGLVFIVFNTLFALLTQEDQLRCFDAVAERLTPGGAFVVEAFVPDPTRYSRGQRVSASRVGVDDVWVEVGSYDAATQRIDSSRRRHRRGRRPRVSRAPALRLAVGARSDGTARRFAASRPLGRLAARALRLGQHVPRLGVGARGLGASRVRVLLEGRHAARVAKLAATPNGAATASARPRIQQRVRDGIAPRDAACAPLGLELPKVGENGSRRDRLDLRAFVGIHDRHDLLDGARPSRERGENLPFPLATVREISLDPRRAVEHEGSVPGIQRSRAQLEEPPKRPKICGEVAVGWIDDARSAPEHRVAGEDTVAAGDAERDVI
jgi:hypothetical protein